MQSRVRSTVRRASSVASLSTAVAIALTMVAVPALSRDLAPIDALATQPEFPATRMIAAKAALANVATQVHTNDRLGLPTFVWGERGDKAFVPAQAKAIGAAETARAHVNRLREGYRMSAADTARLQVVESRQLDGGSSLVRFVHRVDGIEIFRESASVLMDQRGALVAIGGTMGPSADVAGHSASLFVLEATDAIAAALSDFGFDPARARAALAPVEQKADYTHFEWAGSRAPTEASLAENPRARPVWFRDAYGLIPAYYVEVMVARVDASVDAYAYVVSAKSGDTLFRHNLTADAAYTYSAYAETTAPYLPYPGPHRRAATPHPTGTPDGFQPPLQLSNLVTLQNVPFSRNDPWLADSATHTDGNNAQAYVDIDDVDGFGGIDFMAPLSGPGAFNYATNFALLPYSTPQRHAAISNLFFTVNWLHDWWYDAGFDEVSNNAQHSNYGRGGIEGDRLRAEAQDFSGLNNANMLTPADGSRPRMQMYLFSDSIGTYTTSGGVVIPSTQTLGTAAFGVAGFDLTREVVYVNDGVVGPIVPPTFPTAGTVNDGCETPFANAAAIEDKIVLIDRGYCGFEVKVANALANGADGVIIANNQPLPGAFTGGFGAAPAPGLPPPGGRLPTIGVSTEHGNQIKAALAVPSTVTATLHRGARDGDFDNSVIAHEWGHYISNRLVQNSAGLTTNQSRGMGEGWGDFTALMMMVKEEDLLAPNGAGYNGVYGEAGFDQSGPTIAPTINNSYYFGFRRYPYSRDLTKNPLSYRHIANANALPTIPPPRSCVACGNNAQVHNTGEVWASNLWECYSNLLNDSGRLTFSQAQTRMKSYVANGYKLTPAAPTLIEARDGVLAAALANDPADFALCAAGFAKRGLGAGARPPTDRFGTTNNGLVETNGVGGAVEVVSVSVIEPGYACDADGIVDNGEEGILRVKVRSSGFIGLTGGALTLGASGGTIVYSNPTPSIPALAVFETIDIDVPFTMSAVATAGLVTFTATPAATDVNGAVPAASNSTVYLANYDEVAGVSTTETFEALNSINWETGEELTNNSAYYWTLVTFAANAHRAYGVDAPVRTVSYIESPNLAVAGALTMTFLHRFQFEAGNFDGGQIEVSTDGGATWTTVTSGITPAYNGAIVSLMVSDNPRAGQMAFVGNGIVQSPVTVDFGSAYAGETDFRVRFIVTTDTGTGAYGWDIDDVSFTGLSNTPFSGLVANAGICQADLFMDGFEEAAR